MIIVATDANGEDLKTLVKCLNAVFPGQQIEAFQDPLMAIKFFYSNPVDALFAAADMPRVNGFELSRIMGSRRGKMATCIIGKNENLRVDAMRAGIDAYLVKPVTQEAVERCGFSQEEGTFGALLTDEECELAAAGTGVQNWDEKPFWKLWSETVNKRR